MGTKRKQTRCTHEFQAGFNQCDGRKDTEGVCVLILQEEDKTPLCEVPEAVAEKMEQGIFDN